MDPLRELNLLLRPAAGGLYAVSTGRAEQLAVQQRIYGGRGENEVAARWREALTRIAGARAVLIGIPSDTGASLLRGANEGPQAIRAQLVEEDPGWFDRAAAAGLVDAGDVFVVPQLLHDEMLSDAQLAATRHAIYPGQEHLGLPVSPLSIAARAVELVLSLNPGAAIIALGGDHSTALPIVQGLAARREKLAVVQVDAHTDLLEERLGVRYCYATWSFHAARLLEGRMVQLGVRASRHDRAHWETTYGVRQIWADEVLADPERAIVSTLEALEQFGARAVYFSNDIDGTDPAHGDATGTPEPNGLSVELVSALVGRIAERFPLAGGDVMEVAPAIARTPGGRERTLATATRYLRDTASAVLGAAV